MGKRNYPSQKGRILEAAEKLIMEGGPGSLRTDAIIAASGLSKGGFFYHFKTMDELLYEIGKKNWSDFLDLVRREAEDDPNPVGRFCRAYIRVSLLASSRRKKEAVALNNVFLELALADRNILARIRQEGPEMEKQLAAMAKDDGLSAERVKLIQMAADGVWFNQTVGFLTMKKKEKDIFCEYLVKLTYREPARV